MSILDKGLVYFLCLDLKESFLATAMPLNNIVRLTHHIEFLLHRHLITAVRHMQFLD
jgi:hypothetical protein